MSKPSETGNAKNLTIHDLQGAVKPVTAPADILASNDENQNATITAEIAYTHLLGLQDHYRLKKIWAFGVLILMGIMIIYQSVLLGLVGGGVWSFKDYTWLLPALLVQNLAQIAGLAYVVVTALFNSKQPLSGAHATSRIS